MNYIYIYRPASIKTFVHLSLFVFFPPYPARASAARYPLPEKLYACVYHYCSYYIILYDEQKSMRIYGREYTIFAGFTTRTYTERYTERYAMYISAQADIGDGRPLYTRRHRPPKSFHITEAFNLTTVYLLDNNISMRSTSKRQAPAS